MKYCWAFVNRNSCAPCVADVFLCGMHLFTWLLLSCAQKAPGYLHISHRSVHRPAFIMKWFNVWHSIYKRTEHWDKISWLYTTVTVAEQVYFLFTEHWQIGNNDGNFFIRLSFLHWGFLINVNPKSNPFFFKAAA